jgi:hypothetical protein
MPALKARLMLRLYRAVSGTVILALVDQWAWSRAGCYTGPSVWGRDERGPGVLGVRGLCEEKASG